MHPLGQQGIEPELHAPRQPVQEGGGTLHALLPDVHFGEG